MNVEIHKLELVRRVNAHFQTGGFHDMDELLEKALDALDEQVEIKSTGQTGAVVLAALEARPYPDIDLTPPRVRMSNERDIVL